MATRHQIIPAVYLLLQQGHRILMLRRCNTGYMDGFYSLVAGHLDGGEPLTRAIAREAREEIGIEIEPAALQLIHVAHTSPEANDAPGQERMDFYFSATAFTGTIENREPDKCADLAWFDRSNLPTNIVPRVKTALRGIFADELLSEPNW